MRRSGSAVWKGGIRDGQGALSTESGVLDKVNYSFAKRFGDEAGTNPEELLGAAHAACFSMALSAVLGEAEMTAEEISTKATVTVQPADGGGFAITAVHLDLTARIPGADEAAFRKAAEAAKAGCPVSKLFKADITLDAKLVG